MSLSGIIFDLKFQVYILESCGDRNRAKQTDEIIKNSLSVQEDPATVSDILKPDIFLIYNTDRPTKMHFITTLMNSLYFHLS